jgi:hypothetical protein
MKIKYLIILNFAFIMSSCITDEIKQQMTEGIRQMQKLSADQDFKKAIGNIELHKLRFGEYPDSLSELKFIGPLDSGFFNAVQYHKLDSGYELNLKSSFVPLKEGANSTIILKYPDEFWHGLGCVKSNLKYKY